MRRFSTVALAFCIVAPGTATAQDDFAAIELKAGQHARVTEGGITLSGEVTSVSADELVIGGHPVRPGPGLLIERDRGHTGWKVIGVGAGIGVLGVLS